MAGRRPFGSDGVADYGTLSDPVDNYSDGSFVRLNDVVSNSVMSIKQSTQALRGLERQIGTSSDSSNIRKRIQTVIRSTMSKVTTSSQQLGELIKTAKTTGDKRQQLTANSIQQNLTSATNNFNTVVESVVGRLQEVPQPPRMSTPQSGFMDSGELDIRGDRAQLTRASPQQQRQSQQQQTTMVVSTDASYLEERADRMEELENDITQLHEIMGDIGQMVVSQGEQIDTIEKHTEEAALDVHTAHTELIKAVRLKRCSRKMRLCICCVVSTVAVAIIITIIIIVVTLTKK